MPDTFIGRSKQFDGDRRRFATADAQRGDTASPAACAQCMQQGGDDARAGCADRMTECAGAAVDVQACVIDADVVHRGHCHRGEGFVHFEQIDVIDTPAGAGEHLLDRRDRRGGELCRGLSVRRVSRTYARENQLEGSDGAVVIGVQPGFPGDVAGIARGDILLKVNQQSINSLDVLKQAHAAYEASPAPTLIETQRNRRVSLLIIKP